MSKTLVQKALENGYIYSRAINRDDLGKDTYKMWTEAVEILGEKAWNCWQFTHDNSGRRKAYDHDAYKPLDNAMYTALKAIIDMVGEVSLDDTGEATIDIDEGVKELVKGFSSKLAFVDGDELKAAKKDLADFKSVDYELALKKWNFYKDDQHENVRNFYKIAWENAQIELARLEKVKDEINAKPHAKKRQFQPKPAAAFRKELEAYLYDIIGNFEAMSYEDYLVYKAVKKATNNAAKKARKEAREQVTKMFEEKHAELIAENAQA